MIGNNRADIFSETRQFYPEALPNFPLSGLLIDKITWGVIFVNSDGVLTILNGYAADLLQVDSETVVGKRVDMLPLRTPLYKVLSEQCRDISQEMAVNGRYIEARSREICSDDGVVQGEMTELWDVTEMRRTRKQWEEFVAMMTHDLRSPLTVMMNYIQGMMCGMFGDIGSRVRAVVEEVEQSGLKLNGMIEEMLDNYRLEIGLLSLNRQSCDMGKILEECYHENLRVAKGWGGNLVLSLPEVRPVSQVDGKLLARAFNNLISNAIKYTPNAGEATITMEFVTDVLLVTVTDTGIGIPAEDLGRIFYKYYRSAGAAGFKGTGLGLAISKTIVEAHNGSIEVESSVGVGSRFKVIIPCNCTELADLAAC